MKLNCYAIYDSATNAYMSPFFLQTDQQALRAFGDLSVKADSEIANHPEDYSLFRIGSYDDNEGKLEACEPVKHLANAHEMAAASRERNSAQLNLVENS